MRSRRPATACHTCGSTLAQAATDSTQPVAEGKSLYYQSSSTGITCLCTTALCATLVGAAIGAICGYHIAGRAPPRGLDTVFAWRHLNELRTALGEASTTASQLAHLAEVGEFRTLRKLVKPHADMVQNIAATHADRIAGIDWTAKNSAGNSDIQSATHADTSTAELGVDVWAAADVGRPDVSTIGDLRDVQLFEVVKGLHVMVAPGSEWLPRTATQQSTTQLRECDMGSDWVAMSAASGLPTNSYSCTWGSADAEAMLENFWKEHGAAVSAAFGISHCEHRGPAAPGYGAAYDGAAERKVFTTCLHRGLAPDQLHADGCLDAADASRDGPHFITVISYPHAEWDSTWLGHTEWAARRCGDREMFDTALGEKTNASLRVAPLGGRTVVFDGGILHRATWPAEGAGVSGNGQNEGLRYSTVMQLLCWRKDINFTD